MPEFTAVFEKTTTGYLGRVLELPEVETEGADIAECRLMLSDAIQEALWTRQTRGIDAPHAQLVLESIRID